MEYSPQSVVAFPELYSNNKNPVQEETNKRTTMSSSCIPELLMARQSGYGSSSHRSRIVASYSVAANRNNTNKLSSIVAWNSSRLTNMMLAVGPGTPASVCWKTIQGEEEFLEDEEENWSASSDELLLDAADEEEDDEEEVVERNQSNSNNQDFSSDIEENVERMEEDNNGNEAASRSSEDDDDDASMDEHFEESETARQIRSEQIRHRRELLLGRTRQERGLFRILRRRIFAADIDSSSDDDDDDDDDNIDDIDEIIVRNHHIRHHRDRVNDNDSSADDDKVSWLPSIRHRGCINTGCWLDCGWRLSKTSSASSAQAVEATESPTQLITSGDDRLIQFWDVRNAMGMANPLSGGWDTFSPLANYNDFDDIGSEMVHRRWKTYYMHNRKNDIKVAGSVHLIATLVSGHRGNVFHVTPISGSPGKVVSCAADGFLRLSDVYSETSSVVVNPFAGEDIDVDDPMDFHGGMAFSHQMLTNNTGLLCSERGLHRFDIRLPPREQNLCSLLNNTKAGRRTSYLNRNQSCKACAVWSPSQDQYTEPNLVFAGGASEYVELIDLRMDGSKRNILQRYRPREITDVSNISVSGLDVSKDGKELLVSYESDQVYSFPVFHDASSAAGPSMDDIDAATTKFSENTDEFVPELASYGGHLNRFTFLKNAKYAGPRDDYVVTGSDSGNAWIYERKTGAVVSLLSADSATCNGIIPHPTLPFFITYGIDSTAKLWRAAPCSDPNADDSSPARAAASLSVQYEMSPVAKQWDGVQALVRRFDEEPAIMPDFIASSEEIACSGRFSTQAVRGICGDQSPRIGNSLRNLPLVLRQNRYECYRSHHDARTVPVEQPLEHFSHRVSLHRLRLQAERLGVKWNPAKPWAFELPENSEVHEADLVPDNPSDWILFDRQMNESPMDALMQFNTDDYSDVLRRMFPENKAFFGLGDGKDARVPWLTEEQQKIDIEGSEGMAYKKPDKDDVINRPASPFELRSRKLLYETAMLLKDGGNQAVKKGQLLTAARRYDKAIQYCAVAFMQYYEGTRSLKHLTEGHHVQAASLKDGDQVRPSNMVSRWSPLLRILITSRLNLSLLLVKPEFSQPSRAADQARHALKLLYPFTRKERKIVCFLARGGSNEHKKKEHIVNDQEPEETYNEARALQAKAYFRLGSAELEMGDYSAAIKSLEAALKSSGTSSPNKKPDSLLIRRLQEAKRKRKAKKKRDRKRFQRLMNEDEEAESSVADPNEMED